MFTILASRSEGYIFNDEPIYKVVNHPSGYVLLDWQNEVIASFKTDQNIEVTQW